MKDIRWYDYGPLGLGREDDCTLYIVDLPPVAVALRDVGVAMDGGYYLVERHAPDFKRSKVVSGPFPTKDAAKAAYIVLARQFPGP